MRVILATAHEGVIIKRNCKHFMKEDYFRLQANNLERSHDKSPSTFITHAELH